MKKIECNKNKTSDSLAVHLNEYFNGSGRKAEHMAIMLGKFATEN